MFLSIETIDLILYFIQQLGILFGVGGAAIVLIVFLVSTRDQEVDAKETQFARAILRVSEIGIWLIVLSGAAITAVHLLGGGESIVLSPAFLFKWLLIGVVIAAAALRRKQPFFPVSWEGFVGANWFALFAVHILAPVVLWADLLVLYVIWTAGFMLSFMSLVHATRSSLHMLTERRIIRKKIHMHSQPKKASRRALRPKEQPVVVHAPLPVVAREVPKPVVMAALKPVLPPQKPKLVIPSLPHKPKPVVVSVPLPHKPKAALVPLPHKPKAPAVPHIVPRVQSPAPEGHAPIPPLKPFSGPVLPQKEVEALIDLPAIRVMPRSMDEVNNLRKMLGEAVLPLKTV